MSENRRRVLYGGMSTLPGEVCNEPDATGILFEGWVVQPLLRGVRVEVHWCLLES